jgi:hypothetical protein
MTTTSDKCREEFEAFAKTKDMPLQKIINNLDETVYKNWVVQDCFESWQASRTISPEQLEGVARAIIVARDGIKDGERRFRDGTIRKAYLGDAKTAIDYLGITVRES